VDERVKIQGSFPRSDCANKPADCALWRSIDWRTQLKQQENAEYNVQQTGGGFDNAQELFVFSSTSDTSCHRGVARPRTTLYEQRL
jgi:hypothetical protein